MMHYKVGASTYYNNVDALAAFTKNAVNGLEFVLPYKFLNNTPLWQKEPPHSVHYYMDKHARILQSKYNRIELRYSGGTDSHRVLDSMTRANVPVHITHLKGSTMHQEWSERLWKNNIKDFRDVSKRDNVKSFNLNNIELDTNNFERYLQTYQGHCATALLHTPNFIETTYDQIKREGFVSERSVAVFGKEKPHLVIENGWWCWKMNDANFSDCHYNFENTDVVLFYFSDEVPELQIKLSWLRAEVSEKIARMEKTKITDQWLTNVQKPSSKWYNYILDYLGYRALNPVLNSVFTKVSDPNGTRIRELRRHNDRMGITKLFQEYGQDIRSNIRDDLYTIGDAGADNGFDGEAVVYVAGVWTKSIPIRPVAKDLLPAT